MAGKKKFDVERTALFGDMTPEEVRNAAIKSAGRPQKENIVHEPGSQNGLPIDMTRATFIVEVDTLELLKDYAYTERVTLKDVVNEALKQYADKLDQSNILKRPDSKR